MRLLPIFIISHPSSLTPHPLLRALRVSVVLFFSFLNR